MSSPLPLNPKDIDVVNIYLKNGMYNKFDVNSNDLVNIEFLIKECEQQNWFRAGKKIYLYFLINVFEVVLFNNNFVYIGNQDTPHYPSPSNLTQASLNSAFTDCSSFFQHLS